MNLYEQQAANRRRTWLVMAAFVGFVLFLGLGFDGFYLGSGGSTPVGTVGALGVGVVSALAGYYGGDRAVLLASGARPIAEVAAESAADDEKLRLRQLQNVVDEMAIASGLPRPAVYVIPDDDPNAFATGRDPEHASLAVTRGLLRALNRDELQGVVAHEMSHVRNYDVRLLTIVAALVGTVALLSDWARRGMWHNGRGRRRRNGGGGGGAVVLVLAVIWLAAILLAPLISRLLAMMVSRGREYLADASAAELTRNPLGLASALEKIDAAAAPTAAVHRGSAHLCIADPLGRQVNLKQGFWPDLLATHPPMANRIAALRTMAYSGTT